MAQLQKQALTIPQSVTTGAAVAIAAFASDATVWFDLNGAVLTVQFQVADKQAGPWTNVGATISASGTRDLDSTTARNASFIRADVTAYTSGEALANLVGVAWH